MKILKDPEIFVGRKHQNLLVVKHLGLLPSREYIYKLTGKTKIRNERYYLCRCVDCGAERMVLLNNLKHTRCQKCRKSNVRHPLRDTWKQIKNRNYKKSNGVFILRDESKLHVFERWLLSFDDFVKDIGDRPSPKHNFGRIDKLKGYTPDNAKWMTCKERGSNSMHGNELTSEKLSREAGISPNTIRKRIHKALNNEHDEVNTLIDKIINYNKSKIVIFKPEAIEYFKQKKYRISRKTKHINKIGEKVKLLYLQGKDMETVADLVNKPIESIIRYYKKFDAEFQKQSRQI